MTGNELRQKREELGLTVEQLAELLKVEPEEIRIWESHILVCAKFWSIFEMAMKWLEFELTSPSSSEIEETLARAEAALLSADETLQSANS
jgi:transcriptional regulator with XRE-family HTH domain